jgi:hypothetical protein
MALAKNGPDITRAVRVALLIDFLAARGPSADISS